MNTLINWLLRLYPPAWRQRYEQEFRLLLLEKRLSFWDVWDIIYGALDARLMVARDKQGVFAMESKGLLRVIGAGGLLSALLLCAAVMRPSSSGMLDGGLTILGVLLLLVVSIALHLACRKRDARRSRQTVWITAACFVVGLVIFILLRQQSNTAVTVGWQGIFISTTFGLWIALNAYAGWLTGLLPHPVMLIGVIAGILWGLIYVVWFFYGLDPLAADGLLLFLHTGMLWLTAQLVWVGALTLWAFWPHDPSSSGMTFKRESHSVGM